jgi:hypothetical protein
MGPPPCNKSERRTYLQYVVTDGCVKLNGSTYGFCRVDWEQSLLLLEIYIGKYYFAGFILVNGNITSYDYPNK